MKSEIVFNQDENSATIFVMNIYPKQPSVIWDYFTKPELLDLWWAPKPWRCETQKLNFKEGGTWNYAMVSPENEKHYAGTEYQEINPGRSIAWNDFFSDENGNKNTDFPSVNWLIGFTGIEEGTKLTINIHFNSTDDMKKILEMGFEEGFKMGLRNLEEVLPK